MANAQATQEFVPIKEIRNGMIVLNDGSLRAVVMASSINFALKGSDEQRAIILQFQNLLNSLDFPIQIYVQSRRLDIRPYLSLLKEREAVQTNELLKVQTREYMQFIKQFTDSTNIMSKSFFVVIPYQGAIISTKKSSGGFLGFGGKKKNEKEKEEQKEENLNELIGQLEQRLLLVEQGLMRTGVRTARLGSEELIELYYKLFNPTESTNTAEGE
ncbi:MAG: TraC family protein [Candidatus Campbellbacteria bacterium]|nr:TraC family protein [Candidatus Campbellbacteria bacterium]